MNECLSYEYGQSSDDEPVSLNTSYQMFSSETESSCDSYVYTNTETDTDLFSDIQSSSDELLCDKHDSQDTCVIDTKIQDIPKTEFQSLSLLSCFLRNKFSASTSRDVIDTLKRIFLDSEDILALDYGQMMSYIESSPMKEIHYCVTCQKIFPEDPDIFQCTSPNCNGLRYKGLLPSQQKQGRQPQRLFVMADVKKQLIDLLQTKGIWEDIEQSKAAAYERAESGSKVITDIMDGSAYQQLVVDGGFLDKKGHNITALFNTDGVNLYSSSKIELWPIFLAINELSPSKRFCRDNILLVGLWQGKGKPPFCEFFKIFSQYMNELHTNGVEIHMKEEPYNVKLSVLCGTTDLPAKAEVLNMSYFNGAYSCISCEDPGVTVKQGKGSARCFPYRIQGSRYPSRTHEDVLTSMQTGSERNRCKGFKGMSGLTELQGYDIAKGAVPDYMHGVLLGVTKVLLCKWFSPSNSQQKYFLGKNLKSISEKMRNIKPPDSIERLPRDLEKHFTYFKATELQSWILCYALPCLKDFLSEEYLENLSQFSEGIYILHGDQISPHDLTRASDLLYQFYSSFPRLYGDGSCGLNVHNIGVHLSSYVKLWGPLWCWSCFPFEDANAVLLQAVHGTGLVLKQVLNYRNACLRRRGLNVQKKTTWKITHEANNCDIAGAMKKLDTLDDNIQQQLQQFHNNISNLQKIDRIVVNDTKFYSEQYTRMQKRVCSVVLYRSDEIGAVQYFVLCDDQVYGIVRKFERIQLPQDGVVMSSHLIPVKKSSTQPLELVDVEKFKEVLVYINTSKSEDSISYVTRMPNKYGHAVFK